MAKPAYGEKDILTILADKESASSIDILKYYSNFGSYKNLQSLRVSVFLIIYNLIEKGLIARNGTRRHYKYSITDKGKEYLEVIKYLCEIKNVIKLLNNRLKKLNDK
jgi:predicted transcriptional regulator